MRRAAAIAAAGRAIAAGITFFDTAPFYGTGEAERRLGAALASHREGVVIADQGRATARRPAPTGPSRPVSTSATTGPLRRSIESSLERLGVDRVDVVHVHDPDDHLDEAVRRRAPGSDRELRDEGVIGAVSVGTNSVHTAATGFSSEPTSTACSWQGVTPCSTRAPPS